MTEHGIHLVFSQALPPIEPDAELQRLDQALRSGGLHPRLVPEAVKLTTVKLIKEAVGANPGPRPYAATAELLGYCVLGAQGFTECNGPSLTEAVEARLTAALETGDSLDRLSPEELEVRKKHLETLGYIN